VKTYDNLNNLLYSIEFHGGYNVYLTLNVKVYLAIKQKRGIAPPQNYSPTMFKLFGNQSAYFYLIFFRTLLKCHLLNQIIL